jgi:hypothetical protein
MLGIKQAIFWYNKERIMYMDAKRNPLRMVLFLFAGLMLLMASTANSQQIFLVDSTASIVRVSGGFGGSDVFDLTVSGSFGVIIDGDQISFRNIDVAFAPDDFASMVFPEYPGTLFGTAFDGTQENCPTHPPHTYSGSLSDDRIVIEGFYYMCAADSYTFGYSIEAALQQAAVPQLQTWGVALLSVAVLAIGMWIIRLRQ